MGEFSLCSLMEKRGQCKNMRTVSRVRVYLAAYFTAYFSGRIILKRLTGFGLYIRAAIHWYPRGYKQLFNFVWLAEGLGEVWRFLGILVGGEAHKSVTRLKSVAKIRSWRETNCAGMSEGEIVENNKIEQKKKASYSEKWSVSRSNLSWWQNGCLHRFSADMKKLPVVSKFWGAT